MDHTIQGDSHLGKRLQKILKSESMYIKFGGKKIPIVSSITIGRHKSNQISIDDDNLISRNHAIIQKIKDSYFIKDLNSTNGTWVNQEKVPQKKYMRIRTNDVIKIGRTELIIRSFIG